MDGLPQCPPSAESQHRNLHQRRLSVSPQKLNTGQFEPLTVRTDLAIPEGAPPAKRVCIRTANKFEIVYDAAGTPRIQETPKTTGFITSDMPPNTAQAPRTSTTPASLMSAASRLGKGKAPMRKKNPFQQEDFSLLECFVQDNALLRELISYLPLPSLVDLYAISKSFHWTFNKHNTAYILANMRTWAPEADEIFPWRCYARLCIKDPIKRQKDRRRVMVEKYGEADVEGLLGMEFSRDVPSMRWLKMVVWREGVVRDLMVQLARRGLMVVGVTRDALKRIWFLMDLPLNAHRIALIRNTDYFPNRALGYALHFLVKVDMALTKPNSQSYPLNHPNPQLRGRCLTGINLREKLTAEKSLTFLWRTLRGWGPEKHPRRHNRPIDQGDMIRLWVRHRAFHDPVTTPYKVKCQEVVGLKLWDIPRAGTERVYRPQTDDRLSDQQRTMAAFTHKHLYFPKPILRPEQLIIREILRRKLVMSGGWDFLGAVADGFRSQKGKRIPVLGERVLLRYSMESAKGRRAKVFAIAKEHAGERKQEREKREGEKRDMIGVAEEMTKELAEFLNGKSEMGYEGKKRAMGG